MTREELIQTITPIAQEVFNKPDMALTDDLCAQNVDTWSSMSFMLFLTRIEEQFCFKFKMMELLRLRNMGAVIDATLGHLI